MIIAIEERFWSRVAKRDFDECWPWLWGCNAKGYGILRVKAGELDLQHTRVLLAHRVSYYLINHRWPQPWGLHGCDNPLCCNAENPKHVHEGTSALNTQEKFARNRQPTHLRSGSGHSKAKFTDDQVRDIRIRAATGESLHDIARQFDVTRNGIKYIVDRKRYAKVIL